MRPAAVSEARTRCAPRRARSRNSGPAAPVVHAAGAAHPGQGQRADAAGHRAVAFAGIPAARVAAALLVPAPARVLADELLALEALLLRDARSPAAAHDRGHLARRTPW